MRWRKSKNEYKSPTESLTEQWKRAERREKWLWVSFYTTFVIMIPIVFIFFIGLVQYFMETPLVFWCGVLTLIGVKVIRAIGKKLDDY